MNIECKVKYKKINELPVVGLSPANPKHLLNFRKVKMLIVEEQNPVRALYDENGLPRVYPLSDIWGC